MICECGNNVFRWYQTEISEYEYKEKYVDDGFDVLEEKNMGVVDKEIQSVVCDKCNKEIIYWR